jgi:hypothetical protein
VTLFQDHYSAARALQFRIDGIIDTRRCVNSPVNAIVSRLYFSFCLVLPRQVAFVDMFFFVFSCGVQAAVQDELKRAAEAAGKQAQDEDAADKAAAGQLSTDIEAMRVSSMYMYKTYTHTHTYIYYSGMYSCGRAF